MRPAPVGGWTDGRVDGVWIMGAQSKARPPAGPALPPRSAWPQDAGSGSSCFLLGLSWGKAGEEGEAEAEAEGRVGSAVEALQGEIGATQVGPRGGCRPWPNCPEFRPRHYLGFPKPP